MKIKVGRILILLALILLAAAALSQRLQVTEYTLESTKLVKDVTLAVVSDLHNSFFGEGQTQLVQEICAVEPDAVLLTGDMADGLESMDGVRTLVQALEGAYPVYYVSGNHECASGELAAIKAELRGLGVRVLEGESEMLPCGVRITGTDDPACLTREQWRAQVESCKSSDDVFTVLMAHRPDRIDFYGEGFDLILSGHAHGGQVRLPFLLENGLWAPNQGWLPKYTCGVYPAGSGQMIVSRGLCKNALPRVFNRPELVVVRLKMQTRGTPSGFERRRFQWLRRF